MIVAFDPEVAIELVICCVQSVSGNEFIAWAKIVWPVPGTCATAPVGSSPTPKINELARVVTSVAEGAPVEEFPDPTAPIAADPFVPDVSTPRTLMIVVRESLNANGFAVICKSGRIPLEKVRQISVDPCWVFVRCTNSQSKVPLELSRLPCGGPKLEGAKLTNAKSS